MSNFAEEMMKEGIEPDFSENPMWGLQRECVNDEAGPCRGELSFRRAAGGTCDITRCEAHWEERDEKEREIRENYPDSSTPPSWFDPTYAGERWNEED